MNKDILVSLAWAAAMIGVALLASLARSRGYIDQEATLRVVAMNGLAVAYYGNMAPKKFVPSVHARQVNRFAGWMLVGSGLIYAGFWAFAPIDMAKIFGAGAMLAGLLMTVGYCFLLRGQSRRDA